MILLGHVPASGGRCREEVQGGGAGNGRMRTEEISGTKEKVWERFEAEAKTELQLLRPFVLLVAKASTYQAARSGRLVSQSDIQWVASHDCGIQRITFKVASTNWASPCPRPCPSPSP